MEWWERNKISQKQFGPNYQIKFSHPKLFWSFCKTIQQKLLEIFLNNLKNSKNKLCITWQALHFCFWAQPQNMLRFWNGFFRVGFKYWKSGFSWKFKSKPNFELDSNNTIQHIPHKGKLVLVYAYQNFH